MATIRLMVVSHYSASLLWMLAKYESKNSTGEWQLNMADETKIKEPVQCARVVTTVLYFFNTTLHEPWDLRVPR